ncbi:hypothetical protein C0989_009049 [Termitomyces sp. Mn162]|nr:hypothetical protein C0989_009049 [Termitomyces sp. Mn162]
MKILDLALVFSLCQLVFAISRTTPPSGAKIVRAGSTASGEYSTVSAAVASLPNDSTSQSIFIYPGTYNEQVYITRSGPLVVHSTISPSCPCTHTVAFIKIYGYTTDIMSYSANQVTIQAGVTAQQAGSDDASGTVRIHKNDFKMYNVNVKNTYGPGTQAIAFSQYGSRVGLYAYVFDGNSIILASDATSSTLGATYLGRPWGAYAKVIFKNTVVTAPMNKALWSEWSSATPNTSNILFAEYNSTGSGVSGATRPSFATILSASQAAAYSISSAVGGDYASWVDLTYL